MQPRDVPPSDKHERMWPALLLTALLLLAIGGALGLLLYA